MENKVSIKKAVLEKCQAKVAESIATTSNLLAESIASMHGETKSSAGDKFETSRAMLQAEQDRLKTILIKAKELQHQLSILPMSSHNSVKQGCIVTANSISYFISAGLGKINVENQMFYAISPGSPIGQLLMDKKIGETLIFNGKTMTISEVY